MKIFSLLLSILAVVSFIPTALSTPISRIGGSTGPAVRKYSQQTRQSSHRRDPELVESNAQRFARGLPPLSPSKSRRHNGTPVRRGSASPLPGGTFTGMIRIKDVNSGNYLGFMDYDNSEGTFVVSSSPNKLTVTFTLPVGQTSGSSLDVLAVNAGTKEIWGAGGQTISAPYFGLSSTSQSGNGISIQNTVQTIPSAQAAVPAADGTLYQESAVWTINSLTGSMAAQWTDASGGIVQSDCMLNGAGIVFGNYEDWSEFGIPLVSLEFVPA